MEAAILFLTQNIGLVLLVVGVMHMFNLFLISRYRQAQINRADGQRQGEKTPELHEKN